MSSDYGSDISPDDLVAVHDVELVQTPTRAPLAERSINPTCAPSTPAPSQSQSQPTTCRRTLPWAQTPALEVAVSEYPTPTSLTKSVSAPIAIPIAREGPYRFTFGKHEGRTVQEVPKDYLDFLRRQGFPSRMPALKDALAEWDRKRPKSGQEASSSQQANGPSSQTMPYSSSNPGPSPSSRPSAPAQTLSASQSAMRLPSSQPTPSKRPRSRDPSFPPSSEPRLLKRPRLDQSSEPPLYRFPFGIHKGKTLLEVPETYPTILRMQGMVEHMEGLEYALGLFEQGKRPSAKPLPPSHALPPSPHATFLSPPLLHTSPSHSVAVQPFLSSAPQPSASQLPSSAPPSTTSTEYRFNFGIHQGKTLLEVAPDYIEFLKERGIVESKPDLAVAVIRFERERPRDLSTQKHNFSSLEPFNYKLTFGKHKGKYIRDIPESYFQWLKTSGVMEESPQLQAAVHYDECAGSRYEKPKKKTRKSKKPKGKPLYIDSYGSGRRRLNW